MTKTTIPILQRKKTAGEKLVALTCYDATFARLLDQSDIDIFLVGDSLGMVIQGHDNTLPVTIEDIIYHTRSVARATKHAHIVADMPFMSYQSSMSDALHNAGRLIKEGFAEAVKLEGDEEIIPVVRNMTQAGIPVMAHIGMRPQAVHQMGGYKVQGKSAADGARLVQLAQALQAAGAYSIVIEGVTIEVAQSITSALDIPTIGICAGPHCDGQVLVVYDLLGMDDSFTPKFLKRYAEVGASIRNAAQQYASEVRSGSYPNETQAYRQDSNEAQALQKLYNSNL